MPWRTEPEIDEARQRYLAGQRAIEPDIEKGIYPLKDVTLNRADVESLLATHESGGMSGPVVWGDEKQQTLKGGDLRGANCTGLDLRGLPLACTQAGLSWEDWDSITVELREASRVRLNGANLVETNLQAAWLRGGRLERAIHCGS
jgi:uncharacterized protein YjbI with pentapeptide repeats